MIEIAPHLPEFGVLLLGGAHGTLALIRSFGRLGIPVAIVTNDHPLPKLSRYVARQFEWCGPDATDATQWLVRLANEHHMANWLLLPSGDAEVKLIASQREVLSRSYRILGCGWDSLRTLCDKQLLASSASAAGIAVPKNYRIRSEAEAATADVVFPLVMKPALRTVQNAFTQAKAWRVDTREELVARYREAAAMVGAENVVIQEFVPGDGEAQFSYAALWHRGAPVVDMTARRLRQYPIEFSYTSTFVEVAANEAVKAASIRLLASINFEGLVEVEYKFDARGGTYKILDVNARPWSWIALCDAAGLDLTQAILDIVAGRPVRPGVAREGHAWIHATRDAVAAIQLMLRHELNPSRYLRSLRQRLVFSTFASDDPWPGILDLPLTLYRVVARRVPLISSHPTKPPKPAKSF